MNDERKQTIRNLLKELKSEAEYKQAFHLHLSERHKVSDQRYTILVIVFGALTGSAAVGLFSLLPYQWARFVVGLLGVMTAVFTGVHHKFQFAQKADTHSDAATKAGEIVNAINMILIFSNLQTDDIKATLDRLSKDILDVDRSMTMPLPQTEKELVANALAGKINEINRRLEEHSRGGR